jgi:glycosyltransferase involved in cell wall biosynthesis
LAAPSTGTAPPVADALMRIAYVAPYHGPTLLERRPIVRNRSMASATKIELIAELLRSSGHEVEVISQGAVIEHALTFYRSFAEPKLFHPKIPIYYGSVLPIRRLNGVWSKVRTLHLLKARHRAAPYDLVMIYNLQGPQLACARHAIGRLRLPVVLEYEDDRFVNVRGHALGGLAMRREMRESRRLFHRVSACIAVSPRLLAQLPVDLPTLLLRGVVGADLVKAGSDMTGDRKNVVLFSGTHIESNGVAQLIEGWRQVGLPDWTLHITGYGHLTERLREMAAQIPGIVFHGLVSRPELVGLMSSARICVNPHQVSDTPGNVFAFKLVEYLASGAHVVTTPMGLLEQELEAGMTYMPDNAPATIAATLRKVVGERAYTRTAGEAARRSYGPAAVARSLDALLGRVMAVA